MFTGNSSETQNLRKRIEISNAIRQESQHLQII